MDPVRTQLLQYIGEIIYCRHAYFFMALIPTPLLIIVCYNMQTYTFYIFKLNNSRMVWNNLNNLINVEAYPSLINYLITIMSENNWYQFLANITKLTSSNKKIKNKKL